MTDPGDRSLTEALRAIAAGEPVDWPAIEKAAPDAEARHVTTSLHEVADIVAFHRALQRTQVETPATWGPLRIIEEIGRGAYGRVFRAVDPRMDREVALKILERPESPDSAAATTTIEEARLLARLKHPNIVAVHGADCIDEHIGLWMEFVDGDTLDQVIRERGPLSADEAVVIGRDVCKAVAAIHRAGLIHRDIKAQNVMRERGGRIVLMDFGAGREALDLATASLAGTPLYLAPEIINGAAVTHHADLYSVGVLLHFLVTGSFPFAAATVGELREAHAAGRHNRLRDVRADLPAPFIDVVERALAPEPGKRFQSAGEFEAALSDALAVREERTQSPHSRRAGSLAVVLLVAVAATFLGLLALTPRDETVPMTTRFTVPVEGDRLFKAAVSPDGSQVVYEVRGVDTKTRLFRRRLNDTTASAIPGSDNASDPFFSPDGKWIGFHSLNPPQTLRKLPLGGGPAAILAPGADASGATWVAGDSIVYTRQDNLWRMEVGAQPIQLTHLPPQNRAVDPRVLPNGNILFTRRAVGTADLVGLSSDGRMSTVVSGAENGRFLQPDGLAFVQGEWIMAARFDPDLLRLTSQPVQVQPREFGNWFDVSATGTFVNVGVAKSDVNALPRFVWVDRQTGRETVLPFPAQQYLGDSFARLSPDGRQIVVATAANPETLGEGDRGRLWIGDVFTGRLTPFTTDEAQLISWAPDGSRVVYVNARGALVWRKTDQSEPERELADPASLPEKGCAYGSVAPGTRQLIMRCWGQGMGGDLHSIALPTDPNRGTVTVAPFLVTSFGEGHPTMSPGGRWVAYQSHESGQHEIWVRNVETGSRKKLTSDGGNLPIWRGMEIFYMRLQPRVPMVIPVIDSVAGPTFGASQQVLPEFNFERGSSFDVSPDGRRFLVMRGARSAGATQLNIVVNWIAEVRQKMANALSKSAR